MPIRKQSRRPLCAAHRKPRTIQTLLVESLEQRLVLSSSTPSGGLTPLQVQTAYGLSTGSAYNDNISFGGIKGDGAGQTIGIFEEYYDPDFVPTSGYGNFSTSALAIFDKTFGLPDPPSLNIFDHTGQPLSASNNFNNNFDFQVYQSSIFNAEAAMDIEWAHAMAPEASIDVLCLDPSFYGDFGSEAVPAGMAILAGLPGVSAVSVSYVTFAGAALEQQFDSTYLQPAIAAHPNVSFFAGSGDNGFTSYPSTSPEVVAVGGTDLSLTSSGQWSNEVAWTNLGVHNNTGGGYSQAFPIPPYQQTDGFAGNNGMRTTPDVSADAGTNVDIYDPYNYGSATPWSASQGGGTSLSAPLWAGMASIADQGRVLAGGQPLGATAMLTDLYDLGRIAPGDFHDITQGTEDNQFNDFSAGPGYDLLTGLGSPKANLLLPDLAAFGLASQASIEFQPTTSVAAGASFGIIADATDSFGSFDVTYSGTATLSLATGPSGATFTPVTVPVTDGVASFQNLSLPKTGSGYTFSVTMTGLTSVTTSPISVFSPKSGVGYFYPIPLAGSLEAAVAAADSNSDSSNIITLSASSIPYPATTGQLLVENSSSLKSKSFTIIGQGESSSVITAGLANRVFEIVGTSSGLSVVIQNLAITGGRATDGGIVGGNAALGGGLLIDGGNVALSNVTVNDNAASGAAGAAGAAGLHATGGQPTGGPGGNGGDGGNAQGGGIYLFAGSLTLSNDQIQGNVVQGGAGGSGGKGGTGASGGNGGAGGNAQGGGIYLFAGNLTVSNDQIQGNLAQGGAGGSGGSGGNGTPWKGGSSGLNGNAAGGGVFNNNATATLTNSTISGNSAGNNGGGLANYGGMVTLSGCAISGNSAGNSGGGVYLNNSGGTTALTNCTVSGNSAGNNGGGLANYGGMVTLSGCAISGNSAGNSGGGVYLNNSGGTTALTNCTVSGNSAGNNGGGLANYGGMVTLTNCTISGNAAGNIGGGMFISSATTTLTNCTVSGNAAGNNGGGLANYGSATLGNTIVAGNTASNSGPDAYGTFTSLGHNLIGETDGSSGWVSSDLKGTVASPLNADLAPLAYYGGPTQTFGLLPGSPAISAGSIALIPTGVKTDQRGYARTVGGKVDIGAYETQLIALVVNTTVDGGTPVGTIDLRAAVDLANIQSGAATITFDKTVFKTPQTINLTLGELELSNTSKTTTITGPAAGVTLSANGLSRVFEVDAGVTASISRMTITGGRATNSGALNLAGNPALGGGLLIDGGNVALSNVAVIGNAASGAAGASGAGGQSVTAGNPTGGPGGNGGDGGNAEGGGIYLFAGNLTLSNDQIQGNVAQGGAGGAGGAGGYGFTYDHTQGGGILRGAGNLDFGKGGPGGNGGTGGDAQGGGIYISAGNLTLSNDQIQGNLAQGGAGGAGGVGGSAGSSGGGHTGTGGTGGNGGAGGNAQGGGIYLFAGNLTLSNDQIQGNLVQGGAGGAGGMGGTTAARGHNSGPYGTQGNGGAGGNGDTGGTAEGGGIYVSAGNLTLSNDQIHGNLAQGGAGGAGGLGGLQATSGSGGPSGNAAGGGLFNNNATAKLTNCTVSGNSAGHYGGGLDNYGTATLTNCTVSGNSAYRGGGLLNYGTATLTNCTVSGNSAAGYGGGLYNANFYGNGSTLTLTNLLRQQFHGELGREHRWRHLQLHGGNRLDRGG